jgi:ATP-dependent Clp protease ATP-binding subunit ClpB
MNQAGGVSRDQITQVLQSHFRPEFLNRVDEIVVFHSLDREALTKIVDIQLKRVAALLEGRGYHLEVSDAARAYLGETGYDPNFGARPLKRAIQREMQDPLAVKVLAGEFHPGATIQVDRGPDGLVFHAKE